MSLIKILLEKTYPVEKFWHGSEYRTTEEVMKNNDKIFVTAEQYFTKAFGNNTYELDIKFNKVFNSLDLNDVKKLYDKGFKLEDPYLDSDSHNKEDYKKDGIIYNWEKGYYPTAEAFVKSVLKIQNSWEPIESTGRVVKWIERNGYDAIYMIEDGIETWFILNMDVIKNIKKIEI